MREAAAACLVDCAVDPDGAHRARAVFPPEFVGFQGHFPNIKLMPGVLIVEAIAQAGGILLYHSIPNPKDKIVVLSKIEKTRFRKPVVPGDQLRLTAQILRLKNRLCHLAGQAFVDGEMVVEGELMASLLNVEEMNGRT